MAWESKSCRSRPGAVAQQAKRAKLQRGISTTALGAATDSSNAFMYDYDKEINLPWRSKRFGDNFSHGRIKEYDPSQLTSAITCVFLDGGEFELHMTVEEHLAASGGKGTKTTLQKLDTRAKRPREAVQPANEIFNQTSQCGKEVLAREQIVWTPWTLDPPKQIMKI